MFYISPLPTQQGFMWRSFAEFEGREGDPLVARHYFARAVNAEVIGSTGFALSVLRLSHPCLACVQVCVFGVCASVRVCACACVLTRVGFTMAACSGEFAHLWNYSINQLDDA